MQTKTTPFSETHTPGHQHETMWFPKKFLWGTATSAHQVEGNCRNNDWWAWAGKGYAPPEGTGPDHYNRFARDFDFAKKLNNNSYRFSIEWSRIEPEEGKFNQSAIEHYREVLKSLRERGLEPFVSLHHFTNPEWFAEAGGWESRRAVFYFCRYVKRVVEDLGEDVIFWITINEPMVLSAQGYLFGVWPPQKQSWRRMLRVLMHLARAHRKSYRIIHNVARRNKWKVGVGIAHNVFSFHAYRKHSFFDHFSVIIFDRVINHLFYYLSRIKNHDFLGLNYYFHYRIQRVSFKTFMRFEFFVDTRKEKREMSDIGWEVYPHGIYEILMDLKDYKKPMYITENGIATENDDRRIRFLIGHLKEIYHAIQAGADVRGYFYWSLIDNYEWDKGYAPRFGLLEYDPHTLERRVKPSAKVYSEIAYSNGITHEKLRFLGHGERA